ncbi:TetR/AcrR family transcriptional regulator [Planomicrobium okeanokoites]|uniref:TetR/AcrR family transcriptional regulator n=1 Tax=Planomicrobium okeanokoites TaxID=244 RepID=UPI000A071D91|nr:TetR/AcrR family transcriptional regulator [Planomicrobium okeanokoites]
MADQRTELQRNEVLRLSNLESNRITRECIESALILLMNEKTYTSITITDIVRRAGVSRTAYYRNYSSKEDILHSLVKDIVITVIGSMSKYDPLENLYKFWLEMFYGLKPYIETFQILLKANMGETFLFQINQTLQESVAEKDMVSRYGQFFWSGAVYSVLIEWIRNGTQQTEEEMATICCEILAFKI